MTRLHGNCNLRQITENAYLLLKKNNLLAFLKPNIPPDRITQYIFRKRSIYVFILSPNERLLFLPCLSMKKWGKLSYAHVLYG